MENPKEIAAIKAIETFIQEGTLQGDDLFQYLYCLIRDEKGKITVDGFYPYKETCEALLVLLTNPEVSALLPKPMQKIIGSNLLALVDFFRNVSNDTVQAELDKFSIENYNSLDDRLDETTIYYNNKTLAHKQGRLIFLGEKLANL